MRADPSPFASPTTVLDDDSSGWLVTFSDIVLQLFAFLLVVGVTRSGAFLTSASLPVHAPPPAVAGPADDEPIALLDADAPLRLSAPTSLAADAADSTATRPTRQSVVLPPENPLPAHLHRPTSPDTASLPAAGTEPVALPAPVTADARLRRLITDLGFAGAAVVDTTREGFVLSLGEAAGYPPGSTEAPASLAPLLAEVRRVLLAAPDARLEIDGHADARPIRTRRFPSNLELSAARAASVARTVVGDDDSLRRRTSITGHAEGRPVADNRDDAGRARNRRVELRVLLAGES